jgi:glyoxylase-like metal-dependent hydrolase (beta-lactamase superfamily II)
VAAIGKFDFVTLLDQPELRAQVDKDGAFQLGEEQHLGRIERNEPPKFSVNTWVKSGAVIDLGERTLQVIATPGHTPDSLMLYDADRGQLFAGDFIYPGTLLTILPGAHLGQYLKSTEDLIAMIDKDAAIFGAHGSPREDPWKTPQLKYGDLVDLHKALIQMKNGSRLEQGFFPKKISVNSKIELWAPFSWNRRW